MYWKGKLITKVIVSTVDFSIVGLNPETFVTVGIIPDQDPDPDPTFYKKQHRVKGLSYVNNSTSLKTRAAALLSYYLKLDQSSFSVGSGVDPDLGWIRILKN
jgi:hypothetical protein